MIDDEDRGGMATLLAWWREMGVDGATDETATDWLARAERAPGSGYALVAPFDGSAGGEREAQPRYGGAATWPAERAPSRR